MIEGFREISSADGWGWNPETLSAGATAGATAFAIVAVIFGWLSWRQSKNQTKALEGEIQDRMRPWVGLYGFEFVRINDCEPGLTVLLRNVGSLPAQKAHLVVTLRPYKLADGEQPNPARSEKEEEKTLVPSEDGNYVVALSPYPQVEKWIAAKRDISVEGTFTYALNEQLFESKFAAELWFSRPVPAGKLVSTNWRNTSAK